MKSKKQTPKCERWTPIRRGAIYCSPGCGYDCTYEDYLKAQLDAERLARQLGEGWTPRVWENLGWHYQAISANGTIKVSSKKHGGHLAFAGEANSPGGRWAEFGKTPKTAVRNVLAKARAELTLIESIVTDCEGVFKS